MSFVEIDDVIEVQEGFMKRVFKELKGIDLETPFPRMTWQEAMDRYGSDKPDTRFGFELQDITDMVRDCEFKVFTDAIAKGGSVRGICVNGAAQTYTRKKIDKLTEAIKSLGYTSNRKIDKIMKDGMAEGLIRHEDNGRYYYNGISQQTKAEEQQMSFTQSDEKAPF